MNMEDVKTNIKRFFQNPNTVTFLLVIALILVTAFLISNTIKLAIFSRKTEIEIMRLVGASNISIKVPLVLLLYLMLLNY